MVTGYSDSLFRGTEKGRYITPEKTASRRDSHGDQGCYSDFPIRLLLAFFFAFRREASPFDMKWRRDFSSRRTPLVCTIF